jgi:hypothetical protein
MRRLYRGLKEPYRPDWTVPTREGRLGGTDFTDCPATALRYAQGRRGVVLVLEIPPDAPRFTEELWLAGRAKRFIAWGNFDEFLVATLPAKELRALVRVKGVAGESDEYKSLVLRRAVAQRLGA